MKQAAKVLIDLGAEPRAVKFPAIGEVSKHTMPLCVAELAAVHVATYPARAAEYGPWIKNGLELGRSSIGVDLGKGAIVRSEFAGSVRRFFEGIDVFIMPTFSRATPTRAQARAQAAEDFNLIGRYTFPFNATGTPTFTLPCGFTSDGRPVAFQLAGPHVSEATLQRVAHAYQPATDWHIRRPPGF